MGGSCLVRPIVVAAVLLVAACSSGDDSGPAGPDDPAGAEETTTTTVPPGVEAERIDATALQDDGYVTITDLVSADGLSPMAVGSVTAGDGSRVRPVVWALGEDRSWARTDLEVADDTDAWLQDVAPGPDGPVAVGLTRTEGRTRAEAWTRTDDGWSDPVPIVEPDGTSSVGDIAGHEGVLVAQGTLDPPGDEPAAARNRVWLSTDGATWEETTVPGLDDEGTSLTDVAAGPGGVAVVGQRDDGETTSAVVWTSPDGEAWDEMAIDAPAGSFATAVVPLGEGFVVGGGITPEAVSIPATWRADADGTWSGPHIDLVSRPTGLARTGGTAVTALSSRAGLVVATNGTAAQPEVWLSTNGQGWDPWPYQVSTTLGYDTFPTIADVAIAGDRTPIISIFEGPSILVPEGETWVEAPGVAEAFPLDAVRFTVADVVVHDGRLVVSGSASRPDRPGLPQPTAPAFWSLDDGTWERSEPDALQETGYSALASTDLGLVAVGSEVLRFDVEENTDDAAVAVSPDGVDWDRVNGVDEPIVRTLVDVAPWRGGWLAVGIRLSIPEGSTSGVARPERVMMRGNPTTGGSRAIPVDLGAIATPPDATQYLYGLCTGAQGIVVVGSSIAASGRVEPLVARADDIGTGWTVATADDGFARGRLGWSLDDCVVDGRQEILLHGEVTASDGNPEPLVWRSTDGGSWARLRGDAWGGPGAQEVAEVAPLEEGWLAVGSETPEGEAADVAMWLVGADDEVVRVPLGGDMVGAGEQVASAAAVHGDDVWVVGTVDGAPAVWRLALPDVLAAAENG